MNNSLRGFTLIELSIVLVIIGLIVGGVLAGRDLVKASEVRAQITQIEKYQQAANTFKGKFGYLPGDIPNPYAVQFGFQSRGVYPGEGDGNGEIQGTYDNSPTGVYAFSIFQGEEAMFWVDLSKAGLIEGLFSTATPTALLSATVSGSAINKYFPQAKIGYGGYVYVWSGGWPAFDSLDDKTNYFAVSAVTSGLSGGGGGTSTNVPLMTPLQAYAIDKKADDGLPQSGGVMAIDGSMLWASGGPVSGSPPSVNGMGDYSNNGYGYGPIIATTTSATYDDQSGVTAAQTCYSNGDTFKTEQYSVTGSAGNNINCVLSFRFQ